MAQEAFDVTDDGKPSHVAGWAAFVLAGASLAIGRPERADGAARKLRRAAPTCRASRRAGALLHPRAALAICRLALGEPRPARRAAHSGRCACRVGGRAAAAGARAYADRATAAVELRGRRSRRGRHVAGGGTRPPRRRGGRRVPLEGALARTLAGRALAPGSVTAERAGAELERAAAALEAQRGAGAAPRRGRARAAPGLGRRNPPPLPAHGRRGGGRDRVAHPARARDRAARVVDRRTNKEIADALFLQPPSTVETHIRNICGKLHAVGSRVEVARVVERADRLAGAGR